MVAVGLLGCGGKAIIDSSTAGAGGQGGTSVAHNGGSGGMAGNGPTPIDCVHDICVVGTGLHPKCDPCVEQICGLDNYCCVLGWDTTCVHFVTTICGLICN